MKKIVIFTIIILCFTFTSCQEREALPSFKPETSLVIQSTKENNDEFKIDEMKIFTSSNFSPETIGEWESYLLDKFNIHVELNHIENINNFDEIQNLKGLIVLSNGNIELFYNLISKNLISPIININNYNDNALLSNYTKQSLQQYSYKNMVYGIPQVTNERSNVSSNTRVYYKPYVGEITPESVDTIEEFYKLALSIVYNDPDENGIDDTYIFSINPRYANLSLDDIYMGFGCYFSNSGSSITFNPNTNKIENAIFNDEIYDCLNYISIMNQQNMLYIDQSDWNLFNGVLDQSNILYNNDKFFKNNDELKIASVYIDELYLKSTRNEIGAESSHGSQYLIGNNKDNLFKINYGIPSFAISVIDPKEVEYYTQCIDTINNKIELLASFTMGVEGKQFKIIEDRKLILQSYEVRGIYLPFNYSKITYEYEKLSSNKSLDSISIPDNPVPSNKYVPASYTAGYDYPVYSFPSGYLSSDAFIKSIIPEEIFNSDDVNFNMMVMNNILVNSISVEDSIDIYKINCAKYNIASYIDEINDKLN